MESLKQAGHWLPRPRKVSMLTLDKAIEICSLDLTYTYPARYDDLQESINLLIEAGKRFKALREVIRVPFTDPLPGEDAQ